MAPAVTTTFFDQRSGDLRTGYDVVGGVEGRVSHFSSRPEFRYTHFPKNSDWLEATRDPNQFEVRDFDPSFQMTVFHPV